MSEKRFVIDYDLDDLEEENVKLRAKIDEQQADLNYLARFIGEFKVEEFRFKLRNLRTLEDKVFEQQATITALKEENEQLKKEYKIAIDEMVTDYKKLEKENEQLQKELQRFKKYVFSQDTILCYKCEHCIKKDIYVVDCEMKGEVDVHGLCSLFREVKV